jgi:hypothetical protein
MLSDLSSHWNLFWGYAVTALNSRFTSSLLVAFFGALFGAYTAKRIADRARLKDELLKEIRNINAASVIAHSIANSHLALKKQYVKSLYETYNVKREELLRLQQRPATNPSQQIYQIEFDLRTLEPPSAPITTLQSIVFDKLTASAKAIMLTTTLEQMSQALADSLKSRNTLVQDWRGKVLAPGEMIPLYFGLPQPHIHVVDQTYHSLIEAIHSCTDDVICFSMLLGDELARQGDRIREIYDKRFPRAESPIITKIEYPDLGDLRPPEEKFTDFAKMFREQKRPRKPSIRTRLLLRLSGKAAGKL